MRCASATRGPLEAHAARALLDAQLLADVWLAMTRGQETLDIVMAAAEAPAMALASSPLRASLVVVQRERRGARGPRRDVRSHRAREQGPLPVDADPASGLKAARAAVAATPPPQAPASQPAPAQTNRQAARRPADRPGRDPDRRLLRGFILARAFLGMETPTAQGWVFTMALIAASRACSSFRRSRRARSVGEVDAVREAVRNVSQGTPQPPLPELTPPLENLKLEVMNLATDSKGQHGRLLERLDTARQQIFFLTNHDALTGCRTARRSRSASRARIATAKTQGSTHALLYIDLDFFHRINDSFGHLAGDELLRRVTPVLQSSLREGEMLARIGGDEFAVLLENCSADFAQAAATQMRDAVQAWHFEVEREGLPGGRGIGVVAITRSRPAFGDHVGGGQRLLHREGAGPQPRVRLPRREHSQHMRQTSRGG
jgi:diguanylate cyclase (GGDEF)-like protein